MAASTSRVTSQNQISIPAAVRRRWGIVPGTELVWEERDGMLVVRPKRYTLDDLRAYLRERGFERLSFDEIRRARDRALKAKHGRRGRG